MKLEHFSSTPTLPALPHPPSETSWPRCFSCTRLIQAALFTSHKWCHHIMSISSKGRLRAVFLQGLQMLENRLKLIRPCSFFIWKESLIERRVSASVSSCSVWLERFRFHHTPEELGWQGNKNWCSLFGSPHLNSFQCGVATLWIWCSQDAAAIEGGQRKLSL